MLSPVRKLDLTIHGAAESIETTLLADLSVTNAKLAADAVTDVKVAADAHIASTKIASADAPSDTAKSLVDDLEARTVRADDETVSGNWTFTNPLVVADGTQNDHAVSLAQLNEVAAALDSRLLPPVADLAALKAIVADDPASDVNNGYVSMTLVLVESLNTIFRFEAGSTAASNDSNIVRPNDIASDATAGRWVKMFVRLENAVTLDGDQTVTGAKLMNNVGNVFYGDGENLVNLQDVNVVVDPSTGSSHADLQATLAELYNQLGGGSTELDDTQTGAGLEADGSYLANTSANYIDEAVSLKDADNKLDTELKSVADRVLTLEGKTIHSSFIDSAVGGETELLKPAGAPAIPNSELTEFYVDGRKARRSSGSPLVERVFTVAEDGSKVTFAALAEGQDVELRYWA